MLRRINFFGWILYIDQQATHRAYTQLPADWDCTCSYCRNFRGALSALPEAFRSAFQHLGIDMLHAAEAIEYPDPTSHLHLYEALYHVVGRIHAAPAAGLDEYGRHEVVSGITISVSDVLALLPEGFPTPAIQIEFFASLPWILDEAYA